MNKRIKIISIYFLIGLAIWIIDSIVDWALYGSFASKGFGFFAYSGPELTMRIIILFCFTIFGIIVSKIISTKDNILFTLNESDERFHQILGHVEEWIWEVDANGLYTYSSPVVEKILGYKPEEIISQKYFYDFFHPDDKDELKNAAFAGFKKLQTFNDFPNRNIHKNGSTVMLKTWGIPIQDSDGNLLGYRGSDVNITGQKNAIKALGALTETFSSASGVEFINKLSNHIVKSMDVDYAFVGELIPEKDSVLVLGGYGKGQLIEPFEYDLVDTPCGNVMGHSVCCYPTEIQKLFPKDQLLIDMDIDGYIGAPLFDKSGKAIGLMVIMDSKPISSPEVAEKLFSIFSDRASSEISRMQTDKYLHDKLDKLERFNNVLVDREARMLELKLEVNTLLEKDGSPPKYSTHNKNIN